jgi:hypothetical protein
MARMVWPGHVTRFVNADLVSVREEWFCPGHVTPFVNVDLLFVKALGRGQYTLVQCVCFIEPRERTYCF